WDVKEVKEVLGDAEGELFCKYYDITPRGNFEWRNIPNLIQTSLDHIEQDQALNEKLEACRSKLFRRREGRIHPHKDDKILTGWNGLAIAAMAYAGRVMGNPAYLQAGEKAAAFIRNRLVREDGRLLARYREGEAANPATAEDYAFFIWGLLELYTATFDVEYLEYALALQKDMFRYFWDEKAGGFFISGKDTKDLILNPKDAYDGAIPSGNSVAAMNLLRLSKITGNPEWEEKAQRIFSVFGENVSQNPGAYVYLLMAFLFSTGSGKEIVIAGERNGPDTRKMIEEVNKRFLPFAVVILNDGQEKLYGLAPHTKEQKRGQDGKATAYVCENFQCNAPTADLQQFAALLDR
ncbi:MAG TPA: thioredoxin domain-containing protein, partial [Clostridiales bacterium]|nr:thioredoxin domain-containing protein [Clostridiales bacterium]